MTETQTVNVERAKDLDRLIRVAERAQRYFVNAAAGNGLNGPNEDLLIGRDLTLVLAALAGRKGGSDDDL